MALGSSPRRVWGPQTAPCQFSCAPGWGQGRGHWGGSAIAPGALKPGAHHGHLGDVLLLGLSR